MCGVRGVIGDIGIFLVDIFVIGVIMERIKDIVIYRIGRWVCVKYYLRMDIYIRRFSNFILGYTENRREAWVCVYGEYLG